MMKWHVEGGKNELARTGTLVPEVEDSTHALSVKLTKVKLDAGGNPVPDESPVLTSIPTIIVVHGRISDDGVTSKTPNINMRRLTNDALLLAAEVQGQVLVVDWSEAAGQISPSLRGAAWTRAVGKWTANQCIALGVPSSLVTFVGHSWGTYVCYFASESLAIQTTGIANAIIALDPANNIPALNGLTDLDFSSMDFARYTQDSFSIKASLALNVKEYGDTTLAITAEVACEMQLTNTSSDEGHSAPFTLFHNLAYYVLSDYGNKASGTTLNVLRLLQQFWNVVSAPSAFDYTFVSVDGDNRVFYCKELDLYL